MKIPTQKGEHLKKGNCEHRDDMIYRSYDAQVAQHIKKTRTSI